jgi:hypothetical protein
MDQAQANARRPQRARLGGETLENRSLLTGGAGSIFALVPGGVPNPGDVASHTFTLTAEHFQAKGRSATLGIDIAASGTSTLKPRVSSVSYPGGRTLAITYPRGGVLKAQNSGSSASLTNGAVLVPIKVPTTAGQSVKLSTHVIGEAKTSGNYILGYYLPGDVDGDGSVGQDDVKAIRGGIGAIVGESNYNFDSDANRDGRIGLNDVQLAKKNVGLSTTITPVISANLNAISDSGVADRITVYQDVIIDGQGVPGATITFAEVDKKAAPVTATVGADGNYSVTLHLAEGKNTFHVTYVDPFGQVIAGNIADLTYQKPLVPVASPTKPPTPAPAGSVTPIEENPRVAQLMSRFPGYFKKHPDQAAKLREMLRKRESS